MDAVDPLLGQTDYKDPHPPSLVFRPRPPAMSTTAPTIAPAAPTTASTLPEQPSRRPGFKLSLSSEQKAEFSAAFDAAKHSSTHEKGLPKSTNMSVAAQRPPAPASTSPQNYEEPETAEVKGASATRHALRSTARVLL